MTNNGTVVHTGGGQIQGGLGTVIYNNGLWLEESDTYFYNDDGGIALIQNAGTFRKTGGVGITYIGDGTAFVLNNSGLVDAQSGEIQIGDGGTSTGTFNAAAAGADNATSAANYTFQCRDDLFTEVAGLNYLTGGTITFAGNTTVVEPSI